MGLKSQLGRFNEYYLKKLPFVSRSKTGQKPGQGRRRAVSLRFFQRSIPHNFHYFAPVELKW